MIIQDIISEQKNYFLYPSTIFVNRNPYQVSTVLGSCISVCLWDYLIKFGGINHYMMPLWNGQESPTPKHGNIAIQQLIESMISFGSTKTNLKAKIFGGASQLSNAYSDNQNIGKLNIMIAKEILEQERIPIIKSSTGGTKGRKIFFYTHTGEVLHKFI